MREPFHNAAFSKLQMESSLAWHLIIRREKFISPLIKEKSLLVVLQPDKNSSVTQSWMVEVAFTVSPWIQLTGGVKWIFLTFYWVKS